MFLVDNTAITGGQNSWQYITNFTANVVNYFQNINSNNVRVALVTYSNSATHVFGLTQYDNKDAIQNALRNAQYSGFGTADLYSALQYVQSDVSLTNRLPGVPRNKLVARSETLLRQCLF